MSYQLPSDSILVINKLTCNIAKLPNAWFFKIDLFKYFLSFQFQYLPTFPIYFHWVGSALTELRQNIMLPSTVTYGKKLSHWMLFSGSNCDLIYTTLGTPYRGIALLQTKVLFRNQARMLNYLYNTWIRNQCLVYNNDLAWQTAIAAKKLLEVHRDCSSQVDHTLNIELQFSSKLNLFFFHTIHRFSAQDKLIFYVLHVNVELLLYIFNCK